VAITVAVNGSGLCRSTSAQPSLLLSRDSWEQVFRATAAKQYSAESTPRTMRSTNLDGHNLSC
jgi:hypothetical protein